jgi:hypothetical protein
MAPTQYGRWINLQQAASFNGREEAVVQPGMFTAKAGWLSMLTRGHRCVPKQRAARLMFCRHRQVGP